MEKSCQLLHLPKITKKHKTVDYSASFTSPKTTRGSIQVLLQEVKLQQITTLKKQQSKKQQGLKKMENSYRLYKQAWKIQKKKFQTKQNTETICNDPILKQQKKIVASLFKYDTFWKPPHRYKTAIAFYDNYLFLYGGFGCQKYLGLTKFSLKNQQWQSPKLEQSESGQIALYGHTMGIYKHFLYIFGGIKLQCTTNQLIQINIKTSESKSFIEAPFRRKQHSMCFLGKYMIIHGGLQNSYQVKNNLFYFDTQSGNWSVPQQYLMPYLSHHSMASISSRSKKKSLTLQDSLGDSIYIFGGKNEKDLTSNKLYRLKVKETGELTCEQIFACGGPQPRHSTCLQFIQPRYLCVFGGKSQIQETTLVKKNGIFNDLYLFDIDKRQWTYPQAKLQLPFRFGFSTCSVKNSLFIFGGSQMHGYSDGCMLQLKISRGEDQRQIDSSSSDRKLSKRQ